MIPHGMMIVRIGTDRGERESIRVLTMSPIGLTFRLPIGETPKGCDAEIVLHHVFEDRDETIGIRDAMITVEEETAYWTVYRLETNNEGYRAAAKRFQRGYGEYAQMRTEEAFAEIASARGLAADREGYYGNIEELRHAWAGRMVLPTRWREAKEIAVTLSDRKTMLDYLRKPMREFFKAYCEERALGGHEIGTRIPNCVYIGNGRCPELTPDADLIEKICAKGACEGVKAVLCLAPMGQRHEERIGKMLAVLEEKGILPELCVNDIGTLWMIRDTAFGNRIKTLGALMCKRRKDPRWESVNGFDGPDWSDRNVKARAEAVFGPMRYTYECAGEMSEAIGNAALVWPMSQLNTSEYCGLAAVMQRGDRGLQQSEDGCARYCEGHYFFYEKALDTIGIGNSLMGLLKYRYDGPIERLVIEVV